MSNFKVVLVGQGGREFAIVWKLLQVMGVEVHVLPGASAMPIFLRQDVRHRMKFHPEIKDTNINAIVQFVRELKPDLVIIGPEMPLIMGLANRLRKITKVFGLSRAGIQLEGNKRFAKSAYQINGFKTSPGVLVRNFEQGMKWLKKFKKRNQPVVLKYNGVAYGKGVIVVPINDPQYWEKLEQYLKLMFEDGSNMYFGSQGVLIEHQFKHMNEWSSVNIVGPNGFLVQLPIFRDYKEFNGLNTGGMGGVLMAPGFTMADIHNRAVIVQTIVKYMCDKHRATPMAGVIYEGINRNADGVDEMMEVNGRFGDPEMQLQIMALFGVSFHELCVGAIVGDTKVADLVSFVDEKFFVGVVMAAKGYPGPYGDQKGKVVTIPEVLPAPGMIFPAGLSAIGDPFDQSPGDIKVAISGGRVLMAVGEGETVAEARVHAYAIVSSINAEDDALVWRSDIAA